MHSKNPQARTWWAWTAGCFFGAGMLRPGPGTWGSAAAVLLWMFARLAAGSLGLGGGTIEWISLPAALAALAIGVPAAGQVERESGRSDPGCVVIDEAAGQWIALIDCDFRLSHALAAFLLFRLFDIFKPWPARRLEKLPAGWGIMLDDVAAGAYALLAMRILGRWIG